MQTPDTPTFTDLSPGEATENQEDMEQIIGDQDLTAESMDPNVDDETLGVRSKGLDDVENEPLDFMRGEVDVKTQMDRMARKLQADVTGRREN
ncbi:MAG: hypothetical protein K2Q26_12805 [Bdellovibrionales bacterium]|nr:hypothetical protein [Bdellovibrionales bacterium]